MSLAINYRRNFSCDICYETYDNEIKLWDTASGALKHNHGHSGRAKIMRFLPDGRLAALGSSDHIVKPWSAETGRKLQQHILEGHSKWVTSVAFSPDGKLVVSSSIDHTVKLQDATFKPGILHIIEDTPY